MEGNSSVRSARTDTPERKSFDTPTRRAHSLSASPRRRNERRAYSSSTPPQSRGHRAVNDGETSELGSPVTPLRSSVTTHGSPVQDVGIDVAGTDVSDQSVQEAASPASNLPVKGLGSTPGPHARSVEAPSPLRLRHSTCRPSFALNLPERPGRQEHRLSDPSSSEGSGSSSSFYSSGSSDGGPAEIPPAEASFTEESNRVGEEDDLRVTYGKRGSSPRSLPELGQGSAYGRDESQERCNGSSEGCERSQICSVHTYVRLERSDADARWVFNWRLFCVSILVLLICGVLASLIAWDASA